MTLARKKLHSNGYQPFQRFGQEREAFFEWLDVTSTRNAERNIGLTDQEVLAAIERAREEARRRLKAVHLRGESLSEAGD